MEQGSMNFTGKPIPLPLDYGINRCLGHGHNKGEWCAKLATCAAHQTISHDSGIFAPVAYRKCMTDNMAGYLPLDGFPIEDCEEEGRTLWPVALSDGFGV
jgi:hypothetical protein